MIEAIGLTKRYGTTLAVDNLSFTVPAGQVTGFLGPNGAGKSTTMRLILGLDAPTSGSVTVNGRPYTQYRRPLLEVGALLEAKAVHGGRSARNHLKWLALSNGIGRSRVEHVLDQVGLSGQLARLLTTRGADVLRQDNDTLRITGATSDTIGEIARSNGLTLRELSAHQVSLEERYMELTSGAVDYRADHADRVPARN